MATGELLIPDNKHSGGPAPFSGGSPAITRPCTTARTSGHAGVRNARTVLILGTLLETQSPVQITFRRVIASGRMYARGYGFW